MSEFPLISLNDAASVGIDRVRKPIWANKFDHLKIDIIDGRAGPWSHLYAPFNEECNGRDPISILNLRGPRVNSLQIDPDHREFVPYTGPLPDSDEYKAAAASFSGTLAKANA